MIRMFPVLFFALLLTGCPGGDPLDGANKLLNEKKYSEAKTAFLQATKEHPDLAGSWIGLGIAQTQLGEHYEAIASYNKGIPIAEKGSDEVLKGKGFYNRGMTEYALAQFQESMNDLSKAIEYKHELAMSYAMRGVCKAQLGDEVSAIADLNESLKLDPANEFALSNRGYYNSKLGDNKTAIADFNKALELNPGNVSNRLNRAYTFIGMGDMESARKDLDQCYAQDPDNFAVIVYNGIVRTNTGDDVGALPFYDKALAKEPGNPTVRYYRGISLLNVGQKELACEELRFAVENGESLAAGVFAQNCN